MKSTFTFLCVLIITTLNAQETKHIITDDESKNPIEFVKIITKNNISYTNKDGEFISQNDISDSIYICKSGYETIKAKVGELEAKISLIPKTYSIEEVIIENYPKILKNAFQSIEKNYALFPYQENFDLRIILKKNDSINKLEDITGIVKRKSLFETSKIVIPKNKYSKIQVFNLRKVETKEKVLDFKEFSFEELFIKIASIFLNPKQIKFNVNRDQSNDKITKVDFVSKDSTSASGYYFINNEDNAFLEYHIVDKNTKDEYENASNYRYKTLYYELNTIFSRGEKKDKYYISTVKLNAAVEVISKNGDKTKYDITHYLITNNSFNSFDFNENVSNTKDIFEIKGNYNPELFDTNKNFILNNELRSFIKSAQNNSKKYNINR